MNSSGNNSLKNKTQNRLLHKPLPPRRRLQRCIAALCGATVASASSMVFGLGLGELSSDSFLGQPLNASIELVSLEGDIDPNSLIVRQVTPDEAAQMGVDIFYAPYRINFSLDATTGAPLVSVTSVEPINEPYLSLMVELRWPKGVVYREYPLLLDPPPLVPVRAATPETRQVIRPTAEPSAPPPATTRRAPTQIRLEPLATEQGKYKVQAGDTLSTIAERWREGTEQSIGETSQWLFENNSHAFANNNINRLLAGAVLQMPDLSAYRTESAPVTEVPPSLAPLPETGSSEGGAQIATTEASATQPAEPSSRVGDDAVQSRDQRGLLTLGTENRDDKTRELIDMLVRENETLKARMEKIESSEYLDTLKQLIVLQRQQISDLRKELGVPDNDATEEMDTLLGQIGVPITEAKGADLSLSTPTTTLATVESPVESVLEIEPAIAPPVTERENRNWLVWLMFGAAAALSALFIGMFAYYRRMVPGKYRQENEEDGLTDSGDRYSTRTEPTLATLQPRRAEVSQHAVDDSLDAELTPVLAYKKKNEDNWLGEKATEMDLGATDVDSTVREVQEAFEDLVLDEDALNDLDGIQEESLEGLTEDLPQEPATIATSVASAQDKPSKKSKKGKKDQSNRRPDEEVRLSIAEKMAQYNPEEYRQEIESLGLLELDELSEIEESSEEDIETIVYRAMMFCEFKKFDKARELIEGHMEISTDPRLTAALEQVDGLEKEAAQGTKKAM